MSTRAAALQPDAITTMNAVRTIERPDPGTIMEQVIIKGDLLALEPAERARYYMELCESLGLNPLTKPFEYIELDDGKGGKKLTLYATRGGTDQLRRIHKVDTHIVARELVDGVYVVTARATLPDGRTDESIGAVPLVKEGGQWQTANSGKRYFQSDGTFAPLSPSDRANAMMKAETKAKRRVILSAVGLGWTDESELDTIRNSRFVQVDPDTGDILDPPEQLPAGPATSMTSPAGRLTERTMKAIHAAARDRGISHDDLHAAVAERYRVDSMTKLTEPQGRELRELVEAIPIPGPDSSADPATALTLTKQQLTWLGNIRKARTIEQLEQINEHLTNQQLLDCQPLVDALEARRQELDPDGGDADLEDDTPREDDGREGTVPAPSQSAANEPPIRAWSAFWRWVESINLDVAPGDKHAIADLIGEPLSLGPQQAKEQVERFLANALD
jgi:hypothetical protein